MLYPEAFWTTLLDKQRWNTIDHEKDPYERLNLCDPPQSRYGASSLSHVIFASTPVVFVCAMPQVIL
jgi:hypothetical protein